MLPVLLLVAGFLIIIVGHIFVRGWREAIVVPIGGLVIATAHFFNYRYTAKCQPGNSHFHVKHHHASEPAGKIYAE